MIDVKNNSYIFVSLAFTMFGLIAFNTKEFFVLNDLTMAWNATHYAINYYDFGFVKRGVVGSFYQFFDGSMSQFSLFLFQFSLLLIFIIATHFFFTKLGLQNKFIYILFVISPATCLQFGSDFGRFDPLIVSVFMLSVIYRHNSVLFVCLSLIGVLIHEIYTFALLPAAFLIYLSDKCMLDSIYVFFKRMVKSLVFYIILGLIIFILIFGGYEGGYDKLIGSFYDTNLSSLYIELNSPKINNSFFVWTRDIFDNFEYTLKRFNLKISTIYMILVLIIVIVYLSVLGVSFSKPKYYLILLASAPMFLLATDWSRWFAFMYISIFITFITTETEKAANESRTYLSVICFYGPLGVSGFSPLLIKLYNIF